MTRSPDGPPPPVDQALALYAAGWFPMDEEGATELPWFAAAERGVLELDEASRAALRRRVRRDVRDCSGLRLTVDERFEEVLSLCAVPPDPEDGIWLSPRLQALYREMHRAGAAHSFELRDPADGALAAGILGVVIGRAALLESMRKARPKAGNALLVRTLDHLVAAGVELCDIQMPTAHTLRLGARLIPRADYEARLARALRRT